MSRDLLNAARHCLWLVPSVPAALGPVWGQPSWMAVIGVCLLLVGAVLASAAAYSRGTVDGIKFMRELWKR